MVLDGTVTLYKSDGGEIGSSSITNGEYYVLNDQYYQGKVKAVAHINRYIDEATNSIVNVDLYLTAYSNVDNLQDIVNITPVTELAVRALKAKGLTLEDVRPERLTEINIETAEALGIGSVDPTKSDFKILMRGDTVTEDTPEVNYGKVLAYFSAEANITASSRLCSKYTKSIRSYFRVR